MCVEFGALVFPPSNLVLSLPNPEEIEIVSQFWCVCGWKKPGIDWFLLPGARCSVPGCVVVAVILFALASFYPPLNGDFYDFVSLTCVGLLNSSPSRRHFRCVHGARAFAVFRCGPDTKKSPKCNSILDTRYSVLLLLLLLLLKLFSFYDLFSTVL